MQQIDQATLRQWVDLDVDGVLDPASRETLARHLQEDGDLAAERRALGSLRQIFDQDRIEVRPGFAERVLQSLPVQDFPAPLRLYR